jgi:hypothetical protein
MLTVKTNSIVALIDQSNPEILDDLKRRFPESASLFDVGLELGSTTGLAEAYIGLAKAGLTAGEQQIDVILDALSSKMRWVKKLKLTSSLITALSSIGLGSAVLARKEVWELCLAVVNFFAAATTIYGHYLEEPFSAKGIGLVDLLERALKVEGDIRQTKLALLKADGDEPLQIKLVKDTNDISAEIRYISVFGGLRIRGA